MDKCDVAIAGAGPVGLYLAAMLARHSLDVRVLEADDGTVCDSRAIGIHPPGLRCLEALGVADAFLERGVKVTGGRAFAQREELGRIAFSDLKGPYPFVLSLPQCDTEAILESTLTRTSPHALQRRCRVEGLEMHRGFCRLNVRTERGSEQLHARLAIGCDGKRSALRAGAGIGFVGGPYAQRFMMVDTADDTAFGDEGAVFLHAEGLVESFPLPRQRRRWVLSMSDDGHTLEHLRRAVFARTGLTFAPETASAVTTFRPEHYLAERLFRGALVLAGDAAHIVSPIGGQGMNLGWQDALELSHVLATCFRRCDELVDKLHAYEQARVKAARSARRRSELFMTLGNSGDGVWSRAAMRMLLAPWWQRPVARAFTMGGS